MLAANLFAMLLVCSVKAAIIYDTIPGDTIAQPAEWATSFTTGTLGSDWLLDTILVQGSLSVWAPENVALEIWTDVDQNADTEDPGVELGASNVQTLAALETSTFTFATMPDLDDNTVYLLLMVDNLGVRASPRTAVTSGNVAGSTLFNNGVPGWFGTHNASMQINSKAVSGADFDEDGDVDGDDFLLWQRNPSVGSLANWEANYGMVAPLTATSAAVPEPNSLALLCMGGLLALRSFRRATTFTA